jgi:hypothetical protein
MGETTAVTGITFAKEASRPVNPETVRRRIETQEQKRIAEGKRGMAELPQKGVHFGRDNGKKPEEIIDSIPGWKNDKTTRAYVQEAQDLYREIEAEKGAIRAEALKGAQEIDETKIANTAEARVLTKRIKAKLDAEIPPKPAESTGEKADKKSPVEEGSDSKKDPELSTEEQAVKDAEEKEKKANENAEKERVKNAVDAWLAEGAKPEMARVVLDSIAAEAAVQVATRKLEQINTAFAAAKGNQKEQEVLRQKYERAEKVLERAEEERAKLQKKNEKMKKDPSVPDTQRLLAYDIDLIQVTAQLNDAEAQILALKNKLSFTPDAGKGALTSQLEAAEAHKTTLETRHRLLNSEREQIGTPEQQRVNYVSTEVAKMAKDIPLPSLPVAEGAPEPTEPEILAHNEKMQAQRELAIQADPLTFLQQQIDNPEVGLAGLLANSELSVSEQKQLLATAAGIKDERAVKASEIKDEVSIKGRQGLLALLLLLYTAHGANKKAKGQQMG